MSCSACRLTKQHVNSSCHTAEVNVLRSCGEVLVEAVEVGERDVRDEDAVTAAAHMSLPYVVSAVLCEAQCQHA